MNARHLLTGILSLLASLALTAPAAAEVNLDMHQVDSGNFYVHATMAGDIETDLLLDTGSSYVSLSQETFNRVSANTSPSFIRHIYGKLASGKVEKVALYRVNELKLAENCVLTDIEVAVFPKADRDILGLNALAKLQSFTMQLAPARLTSTGCSA